MNQATAIFNEMMEKDYCSQWLGIEAVTLDEGHCLVKMTVRQEMLNGFGILHGGIAFTFADSAFAFAANSYGRLAVSINGNMSYAKSATEGEVIFAEAKALHVGHRTADFTVDIYNEAQAKLYFFRGTVYRTSKELIDK
ncbi:MAG: PaaI family thioesterase [Saprospiraceae bacterium]